MNRKAVLILTATLLFVGICIAVILQKKEQRVESKGQEIVIGCILDLTGPVAPYGQWSKKGLELALDDLPRKKWAQSLKVRLVIEDGKSSPKDAVSAFNKLITKDRVKVVIITTGSSSVLSLAPIANERHVVLFTPAASAPEITQAGDYVFRNRVSGLYEVQELATAAYNILSLRRVSCLVVNNDFGQSYRTAFEDDFRKLGGDIASVESFDQGATDLRAQLTKLKQVRSDAVYLVGYAVECGHALRQAREIGLDTRWLSTIGIEAPKVIEIAGNATDGVIYTAPRYVTDDPETKHFDEVYREKFGEGSNMYAANTYDAVMILAQVISEKGYDAGAIRSGLYEVKDYPGVSGLTTFDRNGDAIKPMVLKVIKDGKFEMYKAR